MLLPLVFFYTLLHTSVSLCILPSIWDSFILYLYTKGISQHIRNLDVMVIFSYITSIFLLKEIYIVFCNNVASTALEFYMILEYESNLY